MEGERTVTGPSRWQPRQSPEAAIGKETGFLSRRKQLGQHLSLELGKADLGPLISRTRGENTCVLQGAAVIGHGSWRK